MEKPSFLKKLKTGAIIATISAVSLIPGKSMAQNRDSTDVGNRAGITNTEEQEQGLEIQIFQEVERAYRAGELEGSENFPGFFQKASGDYQIYYELDLKNLEGQEKPKITVRYKSNNSNYLLELDLAKKSKLEIVFNYKDSSLEDAEEMTMADFAQEFFIIIGELRSEKEHPIRFRGITDEEKEQILIGVKEVLGHQ